MLIEDHAPKTRNDICAILAAMKDGASDVILDRCVARTGGYFYLEGYRSKRLCWNEVADKLARRISKR